MPRLTAFGPCDNARAVFTRRRAWFLAAFVVLSAILVSLVLRGRHLAHVEGCTPDEFDFGTVDAGSTLEFSARFLTTGPKGLWERLGVRLAERLPNAWQPRVRQWFTSSQPPAPFVPVDLKLLQPKVEAPDFVQVTEVTPRQEKEFYRGRPFIAVHGRLNIAQAGKYSGSIKVSLGERQAFLPIRVRVRVGEPGRPKVLVVMTPYAEHTTERGSEFQTATGVLSALGAAVDCVWRLPVSLDGYRTMLLADSTLANISPEDVARVRNFVEKGGRLILPCNAFFMNTVARANEILADYGLWVEEKDMSGVYNATNIVADLLTRGVGRLEFHRPSPVLVIDGAKGKLLARDPTGPGGFVAVARLDGGGEIVVLGESLWWYWVTRFKDAPDNARLLQNVLTAQGGQLPAGAARAELRITTPLKAHSSNPNYFADASGKAVYLTGSHTWNDFQDWGTDDSPQPFDFAAYVKMLVAHHHNFTLLWQTELPVFRGLPTQTKDSPDFFVTPQPWQRTGPGNASDGKLKFDLTKFNQEYFDRLRARVQQLNAEGIYAGVYLFSGEWLLRFRFPGDGYPLTGSNNGNAIDDGGGVGSVTMTATNAITSIQDAFVRKLIDTLNDLPNVLWIVSQEAPPGSEWWNSHLISLTRAYEAGQPLQHPIGFGVLADNNDATIMNSDADWIAPAARISSTRSCGSGHPACKVNINDSDHSYFGMWNDSAQANRNYFWINFTQGNQTLFMDPYVVFYPREKRNLCPAPVHGIGSAPDPRWNNVRDSMGHIRGYADRLNLAAMVPRGDLSSTEHALVSTASAHPEILVYAPSGGNFTVNLAGVDGSLAVEWMDLATGAKYVGPPVSGGSALTFTPPFRGDAVLYLYRKASGKK